MISSRYTLRISSTYQKLLKEATFHDLKITEKISKNLSLPIYPNLDFDKLKR